MKRVIVCLSAFLVFLQPPSRSASAAPLDPSVREGETSSDSSRQTWKALLNQAAALGLPTRFLKAIPPEFVRFEFEDLHAYAAEYHPGEHRMVLNRSLSFNGAGATLKPLDHIMHKDIETLFHELFHAYIDYLASDPAATVERTDGRVLLQLARTYQQCRYQDVRITPVVQRKTETEQRYLSEQESWEVLNETWAVFVGWAVWTQLEVRGKGGARKKSSDFSEAWIERLRKSDKDADLRGYYQPEDPDERAVTRKRFLAADYRISPKEIGALMEKALGYSAGLVRRSIAVLAHDRAPIRGENGCTETS